MAISKTNVTVLSGHAIQANFVTQLALALDNSYPTGGYALALADDIPGHSVLFVDVQPVAGYLFSWDRANGKLIVLDAATGAEIADTTDLSSVTGLVVTVFSE